MRQFIGLLCGVAAVLILLIPDGTDDPKPPATGDSVAESFDIYEDLWRKHAVAAADKLASGEFTKDIEVWEYLAAGQEPARKAAFNDLAKSEQEKFNAAGEWSAELHEEILRSYADGR
jgi:hypothetical protein